MFKELFKFKENEFQWFRVMGWIGGKAKRKEEGKKTQQNLSSSAGKKVFRSGGNFKSAISPCRRSVVKLAFVDV